MRPASNRPDADALPELRRLLLGHRQADVLDDLADGLPEEDAESISQVLPDAVRLRSQRDNDLGDALAPAIEDGLTQSVQRNPKPIADAIFPVIFPAIRRAIQHALASSLQSVNTALNYGLSVRAMKWRMEAWRSGLSFPEVVLKHTLQYRVEQVLLVHRESGLLLEHVIAPEIEATDADLVSSMLTAIRQFVEDSFRVSEGEALDAVQVGDLNVLVEPGPHAVIAAVVRGQPPETLRDVMVESVEAIHRRFSVELKGFSGDASGFILAKPVLERCLESEYVEDAKRTSPLIWVLLIVCIAGVGWWMYSSVKQSQRDASYINLLTSTPGIEVIEAERRDGRLHISGLRDPLAADPLNLLGQTNLTTEDLVGDWSGFLSMDPDLITRRARRLLNAPESVSFAVDSTGRLVGSGVAEASWVRDATLHAAYVPGVSGVGFSAIRTPLDLVNERLQGYTFEMAENAATLLPGQEEAVDAVVAEATLLSQSVDNVDGDVVLQVIGHTDAIGNERANIALSRRRAEAVIAQLPDELFGVQNLSIQAVGRGSSERLADGEHPPSRRVTFRLQVGDSEDQP